MDAQVFYRRVRDKLGGFAWEDAKRGTAAVFHTLRDRLTPEEADQVVTQLPAPLKVVWEAGEAPGREPLKLHRRGFFARVQEEAGLASDKKAEWLVLAVFGALKAQLSPGEADDVLAQLPKDLKEVWLEAT